MHEMEGRKVQSLRNGWRARQPKTIPQTISKPIARISQRSMVHHQSPRGVRSAREVMAQLSFTDDWPMGEKPGKACTSERKASPRSSKFRN